MIRNERFTPEMNEHRYISGVVLAAGLSTRMKGENKLLLEVEGKPLIRRVVESALLANLDEVIVVIGEDDFELRRVLRDLYVRFVINRHAVAGMSTSIVAGVRDLNPNSEGVIILLGDQPNIEYETIRLFMEKFSVDKNRIVASQADDYLGCPALFDSAFYPQLMRLKGDVGAKSVIDSFESEVATVPVASYELIDVDTIEDLERARQAFARAQYGEIS